ncbi:response regulator [uncultured Friedmanniella sp.]|uniref:response regulator n=1 Tax=uncultured Friedmanniella sp. TaxID=335381 RepID=UPI0035CB125E
MLTQIMNTTLYLGLAASSLYLWWRRRDTASAWLAGAWNILGVAVIVGLVLPQGTGPRHGFDEWLLKVGWVLPLLLYPYCLLRFAGSFDRGRLVRRYAGIQTIIAAGTMLAFPYWPGSDQHPWWLSTWTVVFFLQWLGLSVLAALLLWRAGRSEPAVTRRRMQLLSIGAIILSSVLLLPFVFTAGSDLQQGVSTALAWISAGCVLGGLNPPSWLRMIWRRTEQVRTYDLQLTLIRAESRSDVAAAVLPVLKELLGCEATAMLENDGRIVLAEGAPEDVSDLVEAARSQERTGASEPAIVRFDLTSGVLVAQTGRYAPVFGSDEVRLFESTSLMVDSALNRIESQHELAQAHDRALEASRLKSEFLANMSHEIRTPINGVIGLTELLSVTDLNEEQRAYSSTIQSSADALLSVLNDILDFSKIEAGKLDLNLTDFDVRGAIEDILALLAGAANGKHIELAMSVGDTVPEALHGDVGRVRQVLLNLAGNAVKFTETGEVVLRVAVAITDPDPAHPELVRCRFEVTDTGSGIAPEAVAALFDSFSQADASSTRKHGGTGLGLAISKRLVELMGGTINVETELGHGSRFWFDLDLAPASPAWVPAPPLTSLRGRSVLVVDDNATNRTIMVETAKSWQLDAIAVADVDAALVELERRHADGRHFDLAWIDHQMPGRNGTELARAMTADERFRGTARVLLTSSGDRSGLESGELHAHLTKPVRPSVLLECSVQLLAQLDAGTLVTWQAPEHPEPVVAEPAQIAARVLDDPTTALDKTATADERPDDVPCVLVAEDNPVSQQVARRMLESLGYAVDIAGTGSEVLAAARRRPYGLVFMDCQMPEMDGYEATAALREHEGNDRHTPVVALTASAMKGDAERCLQAGMDDYLTKPVRIADFRAALNRWLRWPAHGSAAAAEPTGEAVDLTVLRALSEDDEQTAGLVGLFLDTSAAQLEQMRSTAAEDEADALRRISHALRGAALSIGASRLAGSCEALEAGDLDGAGAGAGLVGEVDAEFDRVRSFLLEQFPRAAEQVSVGAAAR